MHEHASVAPPQTPRAQLSAPFLTFLLLSLALFLASSLYVVLRVATNPGPRYGLPFDLYTRKPFFDLTGYMVEIPLVHTPNFFLGSWPFVYPAPSVFIFKLFSLFSTLPLPHSNIRSILLYLATALAGLLYLRYRFALSLRQRGMPLLHARLFTWGTLLLSWPILYALHQGNIEALLWMGVAFAIRLYRHHRWWAFALVIGVVGSFKLYPLVFLLLLLPLKQWRAIAGGVLAFTAMTVAGIAYIGPTFLVAYHHISAGIASFTRIGLSLSGVPHDSKPFDHSLDGLLHGTLSASPAATAVLIHGYTPVVGLAFFILFFTRVRKLPAANQLLFLSLSAVTLPPISFDYTLQLLYVPFAWIVLDSFRPRPAPAPSRPAAAHPNWFLPVMVCFALILSPELFLKVGSTLFYGQFKAVILLTLFGLCLAYPFEEAQHAMPGHLPQPVLP